MLEIRKRFPNDTLVVTGNATTNALLLSINDKFGFKPHKEIIVSQMNSEDLEKYLARK
jgi:hypothetical protein